MNWRNMKKLGDFAFGAEAVEKDGNKYNTLVRELQPEDCDRLVEIVRCHSRRATRALYIAYCEGKEQFMRNVGDRKLNNILDIFGNVGQRYSKSEKVVERYIRSFSDEQLFSPYGPIQAPFEEDVKEYIKSAIDERNQPDRDTFRLGIEINSRLTGVFVFDFKEKTIKDDGKNYRTIGDIGICTEDSETVRLGWRYAIYPVMYFINSVVKGRVDKSEDLYISITTHPCRFETQKLLGSCFTGMEGNIPSAYGPRKTFVCEYAKFIGNFLPRPRSLRIKITNILVDGGNKLGRGFIKKALLVFLAAVLCGVMVSA
jgi:hypothetical protein